MFLIGVIGALFVVAALGIWSGRQVKTVSDFAEGSGRTGFSIVAGSILGTVIGGASTIGTAQLAFQYGLSAWNFSLGCAAGCLLLAFVTSDRVRRMAASTVNLKIRAVYGPSAATIAACVSVFGFLITLLGQVVSGESMIRTLLPELGAAAGVLIVVLFMAIYVIFGGLWGAGILGILKTMMLLAMMAFCIVKVLFLVGDFSGFAAGFEPQRFWNLFGRGVNTDLGSLVSVMLGVACNQSYVQIMRSGRSDQVSRASCISGALVIPPISFGGVLVGLYMRSVAPEAVLSDPAAAAAAASQALPQFLMEHTPPLIAGVFLTFLFVAIIGSGAGMLLGMSTIIRKDLVGHFTQRFERPDRALRFTRAEIAAVLAVEFAAALSGNAAILDITVYGTALRTSAALLPFLTALCIPGRVPRRWMVAAMLVSIAAMLYGKMAHTSINEIFLCLLAGGAVTLAGTLRQTFSLRKT